MNMDTTTKTNLTHCLSLLPKIAEKQKWEFYYDADLDNFYYSPSKIPKDATLFSLNEEISFYIRPNNEVVGIFIEYLNSNFLQHHKMYKEMLTIFKKTGTVKKTSKNTEKEEFYKEALFGYIQKNIPEQSTVVPTAT